MSRHDRDADAEQIDTTDAEDAELLVADPEDYHEAQRLKEIHDARQEVRRVLNGVDGFTGDSQHQTQQIDLAQAVSAYAMELEPLMNTLDYDDTLPESFPFESINHFMTNLGGHDGKTAHYNVSMYVFRQCNKFLAEVKPLVQEDDTNEWEI